MNDHANVGRAMLESICRVQNLDAFREQNWQGTFDAYLGIVKERPEVTRTAFERVYDMILSYGTSEYIDNKKKVTHFHFFDDPDNGGQDAVYGLDIPLMKLVNIFQSAARRYGT